MKKFLFTFCAAIMTMVAAAQTTPPATATVEQWTFSAYYTDAETEGEYMSEPMDVAFDGNDVYFFFPNPISGNAWVKGTRNGETVTFAKGQSLGSVTYEGQTYRGYFCACDEQMTLQNAVFEYDEESKAFFTEQYILVNSSKLSFSPWCIFLNVTISAAATSTDKPIEVPEDLKTEEYLLKATSVDFNEDGSVSSMEPVSWNVRVGISGNDLYIQGLTDFMPEAWVKGSIDDDEVTLPSGQYYGSFQIGTTQFLPLYFAGMMVDKMADPVLSYDAETGTYSAGSYYIVLNSSATDLRPYEVLAGLTLTRIVERAATPAAPIITAYMPYDAEEEYGAIEMYIPTYDTDNNGLLTDKLSYQLYKDVKGEVSPIVFNKADYEELPQESMTEIPYTFYDDFDFFFGGSRVYLYENVQYDRIGVQTIYRGNGEERRSEIVWWDTAGIGHAAINSEVISERYTDLQGRTVTAATKGLLLKTMKMADGTQKTVKVVRR